MILLYVCGRSKDQPRRRGLSLRKTGETNEAKKWIVFSAVVGACKNAGACSIHVNPLIPPSVVGGDANNGQNPLIPSLAHRLPITVNPRSRRAPPGVAYP